ncbi:MAG TPA: hypothetical protein VIG94_11280 [Faecalibacter sp.]
MTNQLHSILSLLVLFFGLISSETYAQIKWVQGNIIIDHTDEKAEGVYITNKRTNYTTKSNFTGVFFIQAKVNDTLQIRSEWYENKNLILRPHLFNKDEIVIHLGIQTVNLSEALISKKLTGILEKDVVLGKKEDDVTRLYRLLNVNPDINPIKDTSALKAGLFNGDISLTRMDVGRIYDAFSGGLRKRKAVFDFESQSYQIKQIRAYFGDKYFKLELNIPSFKIDEFIITALTNSNNIHQLKNPNYFYLQNILKDYSTKYMEDLFKDRITKKYIEEIDESQLYIGVPLDSIPSD